MSHPISISLPSSDMSPPAFAWEEWYAGVGGRTIDIPEVTELLRKIHDEQYPRFDGPVAAERVEFDSAEHAAESIKQKARELGADIVGVCEIEPSDIYRGRFVSGRYAVALGQRMRYR